MKNIKSNNFEMDKWYEFNGLLCGNCEVIRSHLIMLGKMTVEQFINEMTHKFNILKF
jgi:hypothetical protein